MPGRSEFGARNRVRRGRQVVDPFNKKNQKSKIKEKKKKKKRYRDKQESEIRITAREGGGEETGLASSKADQKAAKEARRRCWAGIKGTSGGRMGAWEPLRPGTQRQKERKKERKACEMTDQGKFTTRNPRQSARADKRMKQQERAGEKRGGERERERSRRRRGGRRWRRGGMPGLVKRSGPGKEHGHVPPGIGYASVPSNGYQCAVPVTSRYLVLRCSFLAAPPDT